MNLCASSMVQIKLTYYLIQAYSFSLGHSLSNCDGDFSL